MEINNEKWILLILWFVIGWIFLSRVQGELKTKRKMMLMVFCLPSSLFYTLIFQLRGILVKLEVIFEQAIILWLAWIFVDLSKIDLNQVLLMHTAILASNMLGLVRMYYPNESKDLEAAFRLYQPLSEPGKFKIKQVDVDSYRLITNQAFVSLEGLQAVAPQISSAAKANILQISTDPDQVGEFLVRTGKLDLIDHDGIKVSNTKPGDLGEIPRVIDGQLNKRHMMEIIIGKSGLSDIAIHLSQTPHIGVVGPPGRGKSFALATICARIALADEQAQFWFCDQVKQGAEFQMNARQPIDEDLFTSEDIGRIVQSTPPLKNVHLIDTKEKFEKLMIELEAELDRRNAMLRLPNNYGAKSIDDLSDPRMFDVGDPTNPLRVSPLYIVVDELLFTRLEGNNDKAMRQGIRRLCAVLGASRSVRIHFIISSLKGTVSVFGDIRDNLKFLTFGIRANEAEYVLKTKAEGEPFPGVFMTNDMHKVNSIVFGTMPQYTSRQFAEIMSANEKQMFQINRRLAVMLKMRTESGLAVEDIDRVNAGQMKLMRIAA